MQWRELTLPPHLTLGDHNSRGQVAQDKSRRPRLLQGCDFFSDSTRTPGALTWLINAKAPALLGRSQQCRSIQNFYSLLFGRHWQFLPFLSQIKLDLVFTTLTTLPQEAVPESHEIISVPNKSPSGCNFQSDFLAHLCCLIQSQELPWQWQPCSRPRGVVPTTAAGTMHRTETQVPTIHIFLCSYLFVPFHPTIDNKKKTNLTVNSPVLKIQVSQTEEIKYLRRQNKHLNLIHNLTKIF